jgi:hypothetical protein
LAAHAALLEQAGAAGLLMSLTGGVWQQLPGQARRSAAEGFIRGSVQREVLVSFVFDQATHDAARLRRSVRDEEARELLGCLATAIDAASCAEAAMRIGIGPESAGAGLARLARSFGGERLAAQDEADLARIIADRLFGESADSGAETPCITALTRNPLFARLIT